MGSNYQNILIIKPGAIGDLLQMTPVIRALKTEYPGAGISLIVGSSATASLFQHNPHVSETIVFDKKGEHRSLSSLMRLWLHLRRGRYDLVINFQRSNIKTWLLASAAFPCRVLVYHKARNRIVHAVVNHLETLSPLGIAAPNQDLELHPGAEDRAFADSLLSAFGGDNKPLIALNPGASHPVNRWGAGRFAALADMLVEKLKAKIILVGGAEDVDLVEELAKKTKTKPLSLAGKLDLLQLGAILEKCSLLVTGDTGPLHVATAVGTRVVALFGAADPARTGPVGKGHRVIQAQGVACVPCRSRTCANSVYLECMKRISPEEVYSTIAEMLKAEKRI